MLFVAAISLAMNASAAEPKQPKEGEKLFKRYCWGCHHQTAEAFGPSFKTIASKRTKEQIEAMMLDPEAMSKTLGYRRNSMPSFADLTDAQRKALADYILQFKETK